MSHLNLAYPLVAFDFDGTLADSFPFFMKVFGMLADAHGFRRIDRSELETLRGYDARRLLRHVGLPLWKFPRVAAHFKALMAAEIDAIRMFEGAPDMLQALQRNGVQLAVVSSNSVENVRAVLGDSAALIAHWGCGVDLFGKRHKLRQISRQCGVPAQRMLYVGDELRDVEAARAEGMACGVVAWGYTRFDVLCEQAPDEAFESIGAITTRLLPAR